MTKPRDWSEFRDLHGIDYQDVGQRCSSSGYKQNEAYMGMLTHKSKLIEELRIKAEECYEKIDGATESVGYDSWLTSLGNILETAADMLELA